MSSLIQKQPLPHTSQQGFTLLELVLVMLIIGLVASTPLVFIDNQDNQFRYEETLEKMVLIERALLEQQSYRNQPILTGFVIDNGVLPPVVTDGSFALKPIVSFEGEWYDDSGDVWTEYSQVTPYLFAGVSGQEVGADSYKQLKGFRQNYVSSGLDSNLQFLDGWGEDFSVNRTDERYEFSFNGFGSGQYSPSVSSALSSLEWQVPLSELDINVENLSGPDHRLAIAVFRNDKASTASDQKELWATYSFDIASGASVSSFSAPWFVSSGGLPSVGVTAADVLIPAGDHPVFLLNTTSSASSSIAEYARLKVIPGTTQPSLSFEVN